MAKATKEESEELVAILAPPQVGSGGRCSGDEAGTVADERAASVCAGVVCGSACLGKRVDAIVQPADLMARLLRDREESVCRPFLS